ncbi:MAG: hypothetical protein JXA22_00245 [Candidatus Thermoplasmatota archaeon]|nr:hypothetical protein [Candidatus Thermoplasmatota archaeon]
MINIIGRGCLCCLFIALISIMSLGTNIVKAEEYRLTDHQYEDPIYFSRYNTNFQCFEDPGDSSDCISDVTSGSRVQSVCWDNNEIHQTIKSEDPFYDGEDYGNYETYSHRIYVPSCQEPEYYYIRFSASYSCRYWVTGDRSGVIGYTVLKSYYSLQAYDNNDNIIQTSPIRYIAKFDNRDGVDQNDIIPILNIIPDNEIDNVKPTDWHGCSDIFFFPDEMVSYIKIKFVTQGSWLRSEDPEENPEGIDIRISDFDFVYPLFSGLEFDRGDSTVGLDRNFGQNDVVLRLKGASNTETDYGTILASTPYLYYNNVGSGGFGYHGIFEIKYETQEWSRIGQLIYRGFFRISYYDSNLNYLGVDSEQFIDVDTVNVPNKLMEPSPPGITTTISFTSDHIYQAKYIRVEILLTGSYLLHSDGGEFRFFDFKYSLDDEPDKGIEILYYYQSDYSGTDDDRTTDFWYSINYYLNEVNSQHLCIFKEPVIDDDVTSSSFTGNGELDVASNDFFFYDGHGFRSSTETGLSLTNGNHIDDDDIGIWGPELEFTFCKACNVLGEDGNGNDQASEWEVNGLYKNHAILGFGNGENPRNMEDFKEFLDNVFIYKYSIRISFRDAYTESDFRSIWDTSQQYYYDYFWDIDQTIGKDVQADESYDDSGYLADPQYI